MSLEIAEISGVDEVDLTGDSMTIGRWKPLTSVIVVISILKLVGGPRARAVDELPKVISFVYAVPAGCEAALS